MSELATTSSSPLAVALVAVAAEMPKLEPDARNPHFNNDYVSLDNVIANAIPVLTKHGIAVVQMVTTLDDGSTPALRTILTHAESGDALGSTMPLLLDRSNMQGLGSAVTYARRYMLLAALGIAETDDDGNAASTSTTKDTTPTAAQKKRLEDAMNAGSAIDADRFSDASVEKLAQAIADKPLADLSRDEFERVVKKIEQALKDAQS